LGNHQVQKHWQKLKTCLKAFRMLHFGWGKLSVQLKSISGLSLQGLRIKSLMDNPSKIQTAADT
jgi:hypothetical protein